MIGFTLGIFCGAAAATAAIRTHLRCVRKRNRLKRRRAEKLCRMSLDDLNATNTVKYAADRVRLETNLDQYADLYSPVSVDVLMKLSKSQATRL